VGVTVTGYSSDALSRSTRLVSAYADSVDGNVGAEVGAVLDEIGRDRDELQNLVASLAGLAGHAVRAIAVRLEADLGIESDPATRLPRLSEQRTKVLGECADALRAWAHKRERRSGMDRRLAPDRRQLAPGNPKEQVNLRLFGERRVGPADRRSGLDRRDLVLHASGASEASGLDRPGLGRRGQARPLSRPRP
jgi:hypothetical protein